MSERGIDVNVSDLSDEELTQKIKELQDRAERKARLVTILDRGVVGDRLQVPLPADKYGEWIPNDKMEIYRMESMGYQIDTEYASKRALHDQGAGNTSVVGDVIFMTCPREVKDIIDEIKREQYDEANSPRGGKQKEERDFASEAKAQSLPSQVKSKVDPTTVEGIRAALTSQD